MNTDTSAAGVHHAHPLAGDLLTFTQAAEYAIGAILQPRAVDGKTIIVRPSGATI